MELNPWAVGAVGLVLGVTYYLGSRTSRYASTTDDFLLARRTVRSRRNAAAVSGEYLSAASFLGVAGLVMKDGADALWYPIGFTAGFLTVMILVAAQLRRSGAYTLPDFMEARLGSAALRRVSTTVVAVIALVYLFPQLQAAGFAVRTVVPQAEPWMGSLAVVAIVTTNVVAGGMRVVTLVQAFQYWVKLFALAVPAFVLCAVFLAGGGADTAGPLGQPAPPEFTEETTVSVESDVVLRVGEPTVVHMPSERPSGAELWLPGTDYPVAAGSELLFPAGSSVPVVGDAELDNASWLRPTGDTDSLWWTYSLLVATFAGTMGLPHVLARFYTNPDGRSARRTTLQVLLLLGLFYLFPVLLGALSRLYVPQLLLTGNTDAAVLELPTAMMPGLAGSVTVAVLAAGAFAAFLSTSSGLLVSVASVISTDLLWARVRDFRFAAVAVAGTAATGAVLLPIEDLSLSVGLSFALAASTFCPLLVLGIWWRGLTWIGATAGLVVGGSLVLSAIVLNILSRFGGGWAPWFVTQPALFTVPAAFATTIVISLLTRKRVPDDVDTVMLRLHAPDRLGFTRDRRALNPGTADERARLSSGRHRR